MNRSVIIAAGISAALALYFAIGTLSAEKPSDDDAPLLTGETVAAVPQAIVATFRAEPHPVVVELKGQTAPDRVVTVKSATVGTVVSAPAQEGQRVAKGALLCGLDIDARQANLQQAEAQLAAARIEYEAAQALAKKGLTPANREAAAKASVDAAEAAVSTAKVELSRTQIRAPFSGVFETRMAEAGDYLSPGSPCGVLVDLSPVLVTAQMSEDQASAVRTGAKATALLANGEEFPASVRYVARTADARTRTFAIEAALDTGNERVAAGITSGLRIPLDETDAIRITPALLTLADDGNVGVRYVDEDNIVRFQGVSIIDTANDGIWVTGLPDQVRLITTGQEFLAEGLKVEPVPAESNPS